MPRGMRRFLIALTLLAMPAAAADYPARPVTLVVAFPPGGASDVLARILGRKLEQILGQPFVIDNRPGAGGNVAAEIVAHAAPDGYTLLAGNNAILATNAALYKKINFDPEADFAPIGLIGSQANILVVNPAVPARSMAELIAFAKANPGKLNFASSGHGLAAHLAGELFKAEAKVDIVHVPYKGAAPALQDVIAGHVQMMFATASSVVPHIRDGKVLRLQWPASSAPQSCRRFRRSTSSASRILTRPPGMGWLRPRERRGRSSRRSIARSSLRSLIQGSRRRVPISASISSAARQRSSPPTSSPKFPNGPRSSRPRGRSWIEAASYHPVGWALRVLRLWRRVPL
jgi:Tripartite tricarboxylate transporter family receptor